MSGRQPKRNQYPYKNWRAKILGKMPYAKFIKYFKYNAMDISDRKGNRTLNQLIHDTEDE